MLTDELSKLSLIDIRNDVRRFIHIPRVITRKEDVLNYISTAGNEDVIKSLRNLALEKEKAGKVGPQERLIQRKRKFVGERRERIVMQKLAEEEDETPDIERYLELPSDEEVKQCYRDFFEATGSRAVSMVVCAVCSREVSVHDDGITVCSVNDIPNRHRLIPLHKHAAHETVHDMLLESKGVQGDQANICGECMNDLRKQSEYPPRLSLANNMWVGDVPSELNQLTLPEQLLIAHLYPRVYVFKLYPKTFARRSDGSTLQRGMRGNVSTYNFNMEDIASMIKGTLMPRPPSILASVISVTFIGAGSKWREGIRSVFRVRRSAVFRALQWLKINNPKYYGDVQIDMDQLNNLPEDDVPPEILAIIRQSDDVEVIDQEHGGYVPTDDIINGELES